MNPATNATPAGGQPGIIEVGQVWRNNQSGYDWIVRRISTPPRREWPLIGRSIPVLGRDDRTYEHGERIGWLVERYSLVSPLAVVGGDTGNGGQR